MHIYTGREGAGETCYKKLAHVILDADDCQDLLWASWGLRRAEGLREQEK